jgi:glycosyltransferase involved in cell wall biosynthesis
VKTPKISVVIPVYNGGTYLEQTLRSLLRQSFRDFEALCINDCSTDNSESILKQYAKTDPRIRVLATDVNQGIVPKVLNNRALPNVKGEYYVYSSQDDLFSEDWLEKMCRRAEETQADAVLPDLLFFHANDPSKDHALIGVHGDRDVVLSNRDAVILSLDWQIPGNALWKASLVKRLGYADFGMSADEYSVRVFFFHCNKVVFSGGTFYYRQDNPDAITRKPSYRWFDLPYTHFKLFEFLRDNHFEPDLYAKELLRSFHGLVQKKQELIANGANVPAAYQREAEERILRCYEAITRSELAKDIIKQQGGLPNMLKAFATFHGYRLFDSANRLITRLRGLRGWISGSHFLP